MGKRRASTLVLVLLAVPLQPAEIVVDSGCSLADAIHAANSDSPVGGCSAGFGQDRIVLTENVGLTVLDNGSNGLPIVETELTIAGNGFRIARRAGATQFRLFQVGQSGSLRLENVELANGSCASCSGGAVSTSGGLTILNSRVVGNDADFFGGGIAVFSFSDVVLRNTTISGNFAVLGGGGVAQSYGSLVVRESTIADNRTDGFGGGLSVEPYTFGGTEVVNSTISGNTAATAGGIFSGSYVSNGSIAHSTFSGNSPSALHLTYSAFDPFPVSDSIMAYSTGSNCSGVDALGSSFDDDGSCGAQAQLISGLDPNLLGNGGPTATHALLPGSSAADSLANCSEAMDQRGFGRSGVCDSGAFELGAFGFDVRGTCPGQVRFRATSVAPNSSIEIFLGAAVGNDVVPGGLCDQTELDITEPELLGVIDANGTGSGQLVVDLAEGDCRPFAQAVDGAACDTSAVKTIAIDICSELTLANAGSGGAPVAAALAVGEDWVERPISSLAQATEVIAGDFDGDGDADVVADQDLGDAQAWENVSGDGTAWDARELREASLYEFVDIDGDFDLDIAARLGSDVGWMENLVGDGTVWVDHVLPDSFPFANDGVTGDIDNDGFSDIVALASIDNIVAWWSNIDGDGLNWERRDISLTTDLSDFALADLDGDGDLDLAGVDFFDDVFVWFENPADPAGSWTRHRIELEVEGASRVEAVDIDLDGDFDLAVSASAGMSWWENVAGNASVWQEQVIAVGTVGSVRAASDIDRDGDRDLAVVKADGISWWVNPAVEGGEWREVIVDPTFGGSHLTLSDIDGDGAPDVVATDFTAGQLSWWRNAPLNSCPEGSFPPGTLIELTAEPAGGWAVGSWQGTDDDSSMELTNLLTMPAGDHSVLVTYVELP